MHAGDGLYGLPQDSGPMALFYNKEVFDKYGLTVPKTWDEYVAAGKKLHAADPKKYITNDTGDAGFATSMIWQAGGKPFSTDGKNVTINLADDGTKKWTGVWNQLVTGGLVASIPGWSDEWFKALGDGTIATLAIGAWMPGVLESSVKAGAGKWRVAPMPTYDGQPATAENGGSAQAVLKQSANPALAAGFVKLAQPRRGRRSRSWPAAASRRPSPTSRTPAFVDKKSAYFGGQKINQVLTGRGRHGRQGLELPAVPALRQQHLRRHRRQGVPGEVRPGPGAQGLAGRAGDLRQPAGLPDQRLTCVHASRQKEKHVRLRDR